MRRHDVLCGPWATMRQGPRFSAQLTVNGCMSTTCGHLRWDVPAASVKQSQAPVSAHSCKQSNVSKLPALPVQALLQRVKWGRGQASATALSWHRPTRQKSGSLNRRLCPDMRRHDVQSGPWATMRQGPRFSAQLTVRGCMSTKRGHQQDPALGCACCISSSTCQRTQLQTKQHVRTACSSCAVWPLRRPVTAHLPGAVAALHTRW
jgi:hypothetical protein